MKTLLDYPEKRGKKTRTLRLQGGLAQAAEEAAVYDLIFNDVALRKLAPKMNVSYQGVYIRAVLYLKLWAKLGQLSLRKDYIDNLIKGLNSHDEKIKEEGKSNEDIE